MKSTSVTIFLKKIILIFIVFSNIQTINADDDLWFNSIKSIIPVGLEIINIEQSDNKIIITTSTEKYERIYKFLRSVTNNNLGSAKIIFSNESRGNYFVTMEIINNINYISCFKVML